MADISDVESTDRIASEASVAAGYRGTSVHGSPGRAREYDSLKSSPVFSGHLFTDTAPFHLGLGLDFRDEDDFSAEAHLDTKGLLRLDFRKDRFFHNLDHLPYSEADGGRPDAFYPDAPTAPLVPPPATIGPNRRVTYYDDDRGDAYGLRLDMSEAKLKVKCPDYPAHFNLTYWRYEKTGEKQQRFLGENCTTACHLQSRGRKIDRVTEEVKAGLDAHAGYIDMAIEALYRVFHDHEAPLKDYFGAHTRGRTAGKYAHDEDPESRVKEVTIRLNTSPAGGLVGNTSLTIGSRDNRSDTAYVTPTEAEVDYTKATADVTYTPGENWTINLRYRLFDMTSSNTDVIYDTNHATRDVNLEVRDALDLTRSWYEAIVNFRPTKRFTVKGEFRREEVERRETGEPTQHSTPGALTAPIVINPKWELPEKEEITRVKLGFNGRFLDKSALKLNGWVAWQENDKPAYGTSAEERQEAFFSMTYAPSAIWGITATANLVDERNHDHEAEQFDRAFAPNRPVAFDLDREQEQQKFGVGSWLKPAETLMLDANYGYLSTEITQDLLFGAEPHSTNDWRDYTIENESVDYSQKVHTLSAGATWQPLKQLNCRLEGYHIRSKASYDPDFGTETFEYLVGAEILRSKASSSDLHEISEVDIRQNGIKGRVDWQFDDKWSCGFEAAFDDYDDMGSNVFDGSVQSYMASISRSW
ncbi:MAG: hypothetical protein FDZ69_04485 [Deltaproteobacteria bacterium]|nr:MAG: hypothetical protein FDZ69_04485 [Deltaproteobacteria bacterium]